MIDTIAIGQAEGDGLKVTLRGDAAHIIAVLAHGLPREALEQLGEAIARELDVRRQKGSQTVK